MFDDWPATVGTTASDRWDKREAHEEPLALFSSSRQFNPSRRANHNPNPKLRDTRNLRMYDFRSITVGQASAIISAATASGELNSDAEGCLKRSVDKKQPRRFCCSYSLSFLLHISAQNSEMSNNVPLHGEIPSMVAYIVSKMTSGLRSIGHCTHLGGQPFLGLTLPLSKGSQCL